jgi:uncharacterized protein YyaL (SSP411 family)
MANRLATQRSAYLRDHRDDPIDWWPWGAEALDEAARRGTPLFVSIGYSACHWCHVMARETFRDPEVADLVNRRFVAVKVDREEHPDVDARFMGALLALAGSGGWPITAVATADGRPAWAATYLPPHSRGGHLGLIEALGTILTALERDPDVLERAADELAAARLRALRISAPKPDSPLQGRATLAERLAHDLAARLDPDWGGFGTEPKFPQAHALLALWELGELLGEAEARSSRPLVLASAHSFLAGGLFDHLDGGFFRYATRRDLSEVHFEKMLLDQAWLLVLLARLAHDADDEELAWGAARTVAFVRRSLVRSDGLLATSLDADWHGREGGAYLISAEEVRAALGEDATAVITALGLPTQGAAHARRTRGEHLVPEAGLADALGRLAAWRRGARRPRRDDKALCDANAAFATALLLAGRLLGRTDWLVWGLSLSARTYDAFVRGDQAHHVSYGDEPHGRSGSDELWLSIASLAAWEVSGQSRWLRRALARAHQLLEDFFLPGLGIGLAGGDPDEAAPDRLDGAYPSVSSLALWHLARLAEASGDAELDAATDALARALGDIMDAAPSAAAFGALSLAVRSAARTIVVPARIPDALATTALAEGRLVDLVVSDPTARRASLGVSRAASVCVQGACWLPIADPTALARALGSSPGPPRAGG